MFGTSKKEFWCCKVAFKRGKSLDDVFTVCEAAKVNAVDVIGAFAGVLTESRFQLLVKDPGSENYFEARDLAEEIAKEKKIKDYVFHETVLGSEKEMKKLKTVGQTIFAYCPGLDAVLTLKVKRDTPDGEERRQDMFAVGDIITQKVNEGQQRQTKKIEKTVVEAATDIRQGVGKVLVTQSKVLVAEGRDNKKEIKETVNQRADEQMAFNAKVLEELQDAKREMKRMNRLLLAGRQLPEIEAAPQSASEQLAFEYQDRGAEPVHAELVEPSSGDGDAVGAMIWTPQTNSAGVRVRARPLSLLGRGRSPESPDEDVAADDDDDDDDAIVVEAPPKEDVAAAALDDETVEAAPLQGAVAAAALGTGTVAAAAAVATPARVVSDWDKERLEAARSAWKQRRKKTAIGEKYPSPPVRDCPKEGKKKDPNWCPDKLELNAVKSTP
jgi:hypothetical protein